MQQHEGQSTPFIKESVLLRTKRFILWVFILVLGIDSQAIDFSKAYPFIGEIRYRDAVVDGQGNLHRLAREVVDSWLLETSRDGGETWGERRKYRHKSRLAQIFGWAENTADQITKDSRGNIYVIGSVAKDTEYFGSMIFRHTVVRVSRDNGETWSSLLDGYQLNNISTRPMDLAFDEAGNLYLLNEVMDLDDRGYYIMRWHVLKGTPDGKSWQPLLTFPEFSKPKRPYDGAPYRIAVDASGKNIYVAGFARTETANRAVMASNDSGKTWRFVDVEPKLHSYVSQIDVDANGHVYASGGFSYCMQPGGNCLPEWTWIRKSEDQGATWHTVFREVGYFIALGIREDGTVSMVNWSDQKGTGIMTAKDFQLWKSKDGGATWSSKRIYPE